jgi:hypothetical protein
MRVTDSPPVPLSTSYRGGDWSRHSEGGNRAEGAEKVFVEAQYFAHCPPPSLLRREGVAERSEAGSATRFAWGES